MLFVRPGSFYKNQLVFRRCLATLGSIHNPEPSASSSPLKDYGTDLTAIAAQGKLDPVIGRDDDIRRTLQILSRRTKNNPILVGEAGVGKTAVAEAIAQRIANKDVPESLQECVLVGLDLGRLVAGAQYRGQFEERVKAVLSEVEKSNGRVLLFIDEIHMLLGLGAAGGGTGAMDASNLLKPALARGLLRCCGATTLKEWRLVERDAALARRFQPVLLSPPSTQATISILRGLKGRFEAFHGIRLADSSLIAAAKLSDRYIQGRFLPDKAIDLVDEAAARLKLQQESKPDALQSVEGRVMTLQMELESLKKDSGPAPEARRVALIEELNQEKQEQARLNEQWQADREQFIKFKALKKQLMEANKELDVLQRQGNLGRASEVRYGMIPRLERQLKEAESVSSTLIKDIVTEQDIADIVSRSTGIPVNELSAIDKERLLHLEDILSDKIKGQSEAVRKVADAVRLGRTGLTSGKKPIACLLFLGPTGVGKTELVRALSATLFGSSKFIVRLDMGEFSEPHALPARLLGAPPGYIGYGEGGQLTEPVRQRPHSIVLLDEFEKAHRQACSLLLPLLDEGHLTDGEGRLVDFTNTIVVLTSNIGADILANASEVNTKTHSLVMDQVKLIFPPEFINRLDDIVIFNRLTPECMKEVVQIRLEEIQTRLAEQQVELRVDGAAKEWLALHGYDPVYGARPLNRLIQRTVLTPISKLLLLGKSGLATVTVVSDQITISID